jgi:hypothetical protein
MAPLFASRVGVLELREYSVLFLLAAAIGILLNTFYGFIASGKIEYHQMGYGFCITTLGAALSNWAAQLATDDDLLPGVNVLAAENDVWTFSWPGAPSEDIVVQRLFSLGFCFSLP